MMMISIEITMPAITGPILMSESSLSAVMLSGNTVTKQNMVFVLLNINCYCNDRQLTSIIHLKKYAKKIE